MVICPIAIAVGCRKCPAFSVCPLKTVIGDYKPDASPPERPAERPAANAAPKRKAGSHRKGARTRRARK
jgi:hypothetical protein